MLFLKWIIRMPFDLPVPGGDAVPERQALLTMRKKRSVIPLSVLNVTP